MTQQEAHDYHRDMAKNKNSHQISNAMDFDAQPLPWHNLGEMVNTSSISGG